MRYDSYIYVVRRQRVKLVNFNKYNFIGAQNYDY